MTVEQLDALPDDTVITFVGITPKHHSPRYTKRPAPRPESHWVDFVWVDCHEHKSWGGGWRPSVEIAGFNMRVVEAPTEQKYNAAKEQLHHDSEWGDDRQTSHTLLAQDETE